MKDSKKDSKSKHEIDMLANIDTVVSILGTQYKVKSVKHDSKKLNNGAFGGLCCDYEKAIYIAEPNPNMLESDNASTIKGYIRHEVVHAYLNESGLSFNTSIPADGWATNEEMVEWIAIQMPKMVETMRYLNAL